MKRFYLDVLETGMELGVAMPHLLEMRERIESYQPSPPAADVGADEPWQAEALIAHLLEEARGAGEEVLGFTRALMTPFETEAPEIVERADLLKRLGGDIDPKLIAKAERLGLMISIAENCFEVPSPTLLGAGERLVGLGVPLEAALETMDKLRRHTERIAETFVQMFVEFIWKPFDDAGRPESDWPQVQAALDQLRPLASEALTAGFQPTMTKAVEVAFGKELDRGLPEDES